MYFTVQCIVWENGGPERVRGLAKTVHSDDSSSATTRLTVLIYGLTQAMVFNYAPLVSDNM